MKLGPRYKIAKRLGAQIFEKTQTRAYTLSAERTAKSKKRGRAGSDYRRQLIEKQKLRLTYGLTEKQFSSYVKKALESHKNPQAVLFGLLETRLDSVAYRTGLASTRRAARQMVSHGHLVVNGKRTTVPSYRISPGDMFAVREGSRGSALFAGVLEKLKEHKLPSWITFDVGEMQGKFESAPAFTAQDMPADVGAVFEYYTR
ncbi:30S ribosomal protein S4 [Candidatus Kaiserbacteria bacterium]|nr:30S ribosomal protein S4 [Candidatus Kaiserbacteria bacterium]